MKTQLKVDTDFMIEKMEAKGFDAKGLANEMGRTEQGIKYILKEGRTKLRTLAELADVLGVTPVQLLKE